MATMLGRLLVEDGVATEEEVATALTEQRESRERLGVVLVRNGLDAEAVARALARQLRLTYAPPPLASEPDALELVPRALALRLRIVPLALAGKGLRVAMDDPLDAGAIDDLQFRTGRRADLAVATPATIDRGLLDAYGDDAIHAALRRLAADGKGGGGGAAGPARGEPDEVDVLRQASEAAPIVALVGLILDRAVALGASDVHVEPGSGAVAVRARVDGVLRLIMELPLQSGPAVVSRLKIMAGLDIAVKRKPQDGRSSVQADGRKIGLRVSTLPAQGGEKVVLRLLDPNSTRRSLESVGLSGELGERLRRLLDREHGLFLVTGPTGSGKTTTLYALLESLDRVGSNVITLEDPVEYRLDGLAQVQVHPRAGLTFATALRAVLRQDPDVILVGEMRDRETAETGLAAALTGHLVLSTLHTIDAPGAVARLGEMKAARYLIAGGLTGVLAQRLVRRLCTDCRGVAPVLSGALHELGLPAPSHLPRAVGCDRCGGTGYRGRVGVFELLAVDATVRQLILRGAPADVIREAAAASGYRSLAADAWDKVEAGLTTLDEVRPLLSMLAEESRTCRSCAMRVRRGAVFCPGCGGSLADRCGSCGAESQPHWRFCAGCGRQARGPSPSPAGAAGRSTLAVPGTGSGRTRG